MDSNVIKALSEKLSAFRELNNQIDKIADVVTRVRVRHALAVYIKKATDLDCEIIYDKIKREEAK